VPPFPEPACDHFDAVLAVSTSHLNISLKSIRALHQYAKPRKIHVLTAVSNFPFFRMNLTTEWPVTLIDEDKVIPDIRLSTVKDFIARKSQRGDWRAGWYFQQFLKMTVCRLPEVADHYLAWDADSILLRPTEFLSAGGKALVHPESEFNEPYFVFLKSLLGLDRQVRFSFISEHFMFNKKMMNALIGEIESRRKEKESWVTIILNHIDPEYFAGSGFSEYETYGNFITRNYPDSYAVRPLRMTRHGAIRFGHKPNRFDLYSIASEGYDYATFELFQSTSAKAIGERIKRVFSPGCNRRDIYKLLESIWRLVRITGNKAVSLMMYAAGLTRKKKHLHQQL
jgi:hypothetical protein